MKLLCLDGNSVLNRAFYAIKLLSTKEGQYTNAIYGFLNILVKLKEQVRPDAVAIAFDLPGKTVRHEQYQAYKATRKGMPPELAQQMPILKELLSYLGYTIVTQPGYEADDVLGTFARVCRERGDDCTIATGDRDALQLVYGGVRVLLTTTSMGRGETTVMDREAVIAQYGVEPQQLIEVKALMGDSSDNIPGVAGIGEKTALALIQQFGSLEGVYNNLDDPCIKPGVRQKLAESREIAELSRVLATICTDLPIDTETARYIPKQGDPAAAVALLGRLEMHSMIDRLGLAAAKSIPTAEAAGETAELVALETFAPEVLAQPGEIYIYADAQGFFAVAGRRAFTLDDGALARVLSSDLKKFCYDAKRLFRAALAGGYEARNIVFDLKLAAYLLNPLSNGYQPERLAGEYQVAPRFGCSEVAALGVLEPLCIRLADLLEQQGMRSLHDDIELPLARVLAGMEHDGFLLDTEGLRGFGEELSKQAAAEQQTIYEMAGKPFNLNSPRQMGEILFERLELPSGKKTKTGYSTDAETLEKLRGAHPIIEHILHYRTCQKFVSTYVEGLLKAVDEQGHIHTDFLQTETRTGRISSREPNLQNIPVRTEQGSRFRRYFVAAPGRVLLDADYSQIELRVLAGISGDRRMMEAFTADRDIHTETAGEIFKVGRDQVTSELRRRAKAVNFGIVYGIGAFSLAQDVGVSMKEAASYIEGYLAVYSGVAGYLEEVVAQAQRDGFVTTLYGRRRQLPELASSNRMLQALGKRLAMNTPIQGTAADIIKIAMIRVADRLAREGLDARLILQVHDELIVESAEADADRAAEILRQEMEGAADIGVPLVAELGRGRCWYDAK